MAENDREKSPSGGVSRLLTRHGGLSYLEIPAVDAQKSAAFYRHVLGWKIQERGAGDQRFEDATGHVIGRWAIGRPIAKEPGLLPYFYVQRIDSAVGNAVAHGGEVIRAPYAEGDLWVATIRDPAGNLIGLWQAGPR
jgi:predicted enzyme related to lactoylglutathione lyase